MTDNVINFPTKNEPDLSTPAILPDILESSHLAHPIAVAAIAHGLGEQLEHRLYYHDDTTEHRNELRLVAGYMEAALHAVTNPNNVGSEVLEVLGTLTHHTSVPEFASREITDPKVMFYNISVGASLIADKLPKSPCQH